MASSKDPKLWLSRQPAGKVAGEGAADRGGEGRPMRELWTTAGKGGRPARKLRTTAGKDVGDADDGGARQKGAATAEKPGGGEERRRKTPPDRFQIGGSIVLSHCFT
ncbi:hypothetical protein VPH35_014960 [Triticum aestivum]